jgi:hypothetical protein
MKFSSAQYHGIDGARSYALHVYHTVKMPFFPQRVLDQFNSVSKDFGLKRVFASGTIQIDPRAVELTGTRIQAPVLLLPVINIINKDFLTLEATTAEFYSDHGAVCSDQHDGDISGSVVVTGSIFPSLRTTGSYKLTYDCSNSNDRHALTANRKVLVRDTHCPVCRIRPGIDTVEASFPFADAGVLCSDSLDGLLKDVVVTSTVSVEKTGQYYVTYHVRDKAGNWNDGACKGSKKYVRTVQVIDTLKPVVALHYRGKLVTPVASRVEYGDRLLLSEPEEPSSFSASSCIVAVIALLSSVALATNLLKTKNQKLSPAVV